MLNKLNAVLHNADFTAVLFAAVHWLAVLLLIALIVAILYLLCINVFGLERSAWYAGRPGKLGIKGGKLHGPKETPNSVVSEGVAITHPAYVPPISYAGDPVRAFARLIEIVQKMPSAHLMHIDADYFHAEFHSPNLHLVNDFEARIDPVNERIQVRSASRIGKRDGGKNRARIEAIRAQFAAKQL